MTTVTDEEFAADIANYIHAYIDSLDPSSELSFIVKLGQFDYEITHWGGTNVPQPSMIGITTNVTKEMLAQYKSKIQIEEYFEKNRVIHAYMRLAYRRTEALNGNTIPVQLTDNLMINSINPFYLAL